MYESFANKFELIPLFVFSYNIDYNPHTLIIWTHKKMSKKIFIIAGESSGDRIGSLIVDELKLQDSDIVFMGVGGNKMENSGIKSLFPMNEISLMGIFEILPHIFHLKKLINLTVDTIKTFKPNIVITIDSPGFCYRIASILKGKIDAKFVHIIAPSVWAYKPERAAKFAKVYDLLLTILPFEPPYFEKEGLKSKFVGNFTFEQKFCEDKNIFRKKYNISKDKKMLCITPGSRNGEIKKHLAIFLGAVQILQLNYKLATVILAANQEIKDTIQEYVSKNNINDILITLEDKFECYKTADVSLAKSGTNSVEIAIHGTPQVVAYKLNWFTGLYIKSVILVKFVNLINIFANREIIPELLQNNCTSQNIASKLSELLSNKRIRDKQIKDTLAILEDMKSDIDFPSKVAAKEILEIL